MTPGAHYQTQPIEAPHQAASPRGRLSVFARTDRGARSRNQDAFLIADLTGGRSGLTPDVAAHTIGARGSLLAVSDGGGAEGDVASELAVLTFHRLLVAMPEDLSLPDRLRRAAAHTARHVWKSLQARGANASNATLTAALVCGDAAHVLQIGHSRAYLVRDGRMQQITKDQTLAQVLTDSGSLADGETSFVPAMMLQSLGPQPSVEPVVTTIDLRAGDTLLLCSDGLSNALATCELLEAVLEETDPAAACQRLIHMATARSSENVTAIVARVDATARNVKPDEAVTWTLPPQFAPDGTIGEH